MIFSIYLKNKENFLFYSINYILFSRIDKKVQYMYDS